MGPIYKKSELRKPHLKFENWFLCKIFKNWNRPEISPVVPSGILLRICSDIFADIPSQIRLDIPRGIHLTMYVEFHTETSPGVASSIFPSIPSEIFPCITPGIPAWPVISSRFLSGISLEILSRECSKNFLQDSSKNSA